MAAPPYMQVWIADWTADVQHLSCEQDGAYWRLIRAMWRNHGSLQNDPRKLAHIAGLSPKKWASICDDVLAFFDADGDVLRHGKLTETLISVSQKSAERSAAGAKGGVAKALKTKKSTVANATILPEQTTSISDVRDHKTEETSSSVCSASKKSKRASRRAPQDWMPSDADNEILRSEGIGEFNRPSALARFKDHEFTKAKSDWSAMYRNWIRKDAEDAKRSRPANGHDQRKQAAMDVLAERGNLRGEGQGRLSDGRRPSNSQENALVHYERQPTR